MPLPGSNQVAKLLAVVRRYISVIQSSRTLLFGIAIALAVVVALTLLLAGPLGLGRGDVYVAVVGPMTGDYANDGRSMVRSTQLYLDRANREGGVNGRKVTLRVYDDEGSAVTAERRAKEIAGKGDVLVVLGHYFSTGSIAGGEVYREAGIPAITGASTAEEVTRGNPWYFRVVPDVGAQSVFMANYARKVLGHQTVSIVYDDQDAYSVGLRTAFESQFLGLGGTVKGRWILPAGGSETDAAVLRIVGDLFQEDPGLIFVASQQAEAVKLLVEIKRSGLSFPIIGGDAIGDLTFAQRFRPFPEERAAPGYFTDGVLASVPLMLDTGAQESQDFRQEYRETFDEEPGWVAAGAYDAAKVAVWALKQTGATGESSERQRERAAVRQHLSGMTDPDRGVTGIGGNIYFDDFGDAELFPAIGEFRSQQFLPAYTQLQSVPTRNRIADLNREVKAGRVLASSLGSMYRTQVVYAGVDINQVSNLDVANSTYDLDFFLWFRYQGQFDASRVEFINAVDRIQLAETVAADTTPQGLSFETYRIKSTFRGDFQFHSYPFDRQKLEIKFRHADLTRENLIFVADSLGMGYANGSETLDKLRRDEVFGSVGNWRVFRASYFQDVVSNDSTLGNPEFFDLQSQIEYSRFNAVVEIERDVVSFSLKNLLPLLFIISVSYLLFYLPRSEIGTIMFLLPGSLLTAALFHLKLSSDLPGIGYVVALDYAFYLTYSLIVFELLILILSYQQQRRGNEKRVSNLFLVNKVVYPLTIFIGAFLYLAYFGVIDVARLRPGSSSADALAVSGDPAGATLTSTAELRILQWKHFIPRYDAWFDAFAQSWGEENGVHVVVDHVDLSSLGAITTTELDAGAGHDLIEFLAPPSQLEGQVLDLTDVNLEAQRRFGPQVSVCTESSHNPSTGVWYGFCHGWVPDPGDYRQSLWRQVDRPAGPATYQELLEAGTQMKEELGIPLGIGLSREIDSNLAVREVMWSFGASVQDENEEVVINSPETVAAVEYLVQLFHQAMTDEVFYWTAASNNDGLLAGDLSYIINSISAYRTAQQKNPQVAQDIYFVPALAGSSGVALASPHVLPTYVVPRFSLNEEIAKSFLLDLVASYRQATLNSELYTFPAWNSVVPQLYQDGGWLDRDPFGSDPADKLAVLKDAETWTTNLGHPGPANAAISEVFNAFLLPEMVARVARGEMTAAESVALAETEIRPIFEKWRSQGLIGGEGR